MTTVSPTPHTHDVSEWVVWTKARRSYVVDDGDRSVTAIPVDWDSADASHPGWTPDDFVARPIPAGLDVSALLVVGQPLPPSVTGCDQSPILRVEASAL